jgi:hypothetical protein
MTEKRYFSMENRRLMFKIRQLAADWNVFDPPSGFPEHFAPCL